MPDARKQVNVGDYIRQGEYCMEHSGQILNLSGQVSIKVVLAQTQNIESRYWHECLNKIKYCSLKSGVHLKIRSFLTALNEGLITLNIHFETTRS